MPFRVAAAQISHETNVFSAVPTDFAAFQSSGLTTGSAIPPLTQDTNSAFGGFQTGAAAENFELVPLLSVWATPSGLVTRDAFRTLSSMLERGLRSAIRESGVDGLLLALHGAMVSEEYRDADGELLALARRTVGPTVPIVATIDLHANISPKMVANADLLLGYHTYPHVDMAARAHDACLLLGRLLRSEIRPTSHLCKPGMLTTSQRMTTDRDPMRSLMSAARDMEQCHSVLDVTLAGGFPAADVPEAGFSVLVTTDNEPDLARELANTMTVSVWRRREEFLGGVSTWDEAASAIRALPARPTTGPLLLVDIGDNPWTGGPGDSAELLRFLLAQHVEGAALASITDREAVARCQTAGLNATINLTLGGKTDRLHGDPLLVRGTVRAISDGVYVNEGPMMAGLTVNL
nr:M81 family metallopeptidase [Chloroflexota bacterium]